MGRTGYNGLMIFHPIILLQQARLRAVHVSIGVAIMVPCPWLDGDPTFGDGLTRSMGPTPLVSHGEKRSLDRQEIGHRCYVVNLEEVSCLVLGSADSRDSHLQRA